jgi:predicted secreted protein
MICMNPTPIPSMRRQPLLRRTLARGPAAAAGLAAALALAGAAVAQTLPPSQNVVNLSASATVELPQDWLTIVFAVTREGPDAGAVQAQLRQALEAALTEARRAARPGQVEVRSGAFSIFPRYGNATRGPGAPAAIVGWQGTAELVVEGRDVAAIAALPGRLPTVAIARTGFSLSREAREKVQAEVTDLAIQRFRARAAEVAKGFGMRGWTLREASVDGAEPPPQPMPRAVMLRGTPAAADESLPVEAGRSSVTATVSGSIQMQ